MTEKINELLQLANTRLNKLQWRQQQVLLTTEPYIDDSFGVEAGLLARTIRSTILDETTTPIWSCPKCGHGSCSEWLDNPEIIICDSCGLNVPDPEATYQRITKTGFCYECDKDDCVDPDEECSSYILFTG